MRERESCDLTTGSLLPTTRCCCHHQVFSTSTITFFSIPSPLSSPVPPFPTPPSDGHSPTTIPCPTHPESIPSLPSNRQPINTRHRRPTFPTAVRCRLSPYVAVCHRTMAFVAVSTRLPPFEPTCCRLNAPATVRNRLLPCEPACQCPTTPFAISYHL